MDKIELFYHMDAIKSFVNRGSDVNGHLIDETIRLLQELKKDNNTLHVDDINRDPISWWETTESVNEGTANKVPTEVFKSLVEHFKKNKGINNIWHVPIKNLNDNLLAKFSAGDVSNDHVIDWGKSEEGINTFKEDKDMDVEKLVDRIDDLSLRLRTGELEIEELEAVESLVSELKRGIKPRIMQEIEDVIVNRLMFKGKTVVELHLSDYTDCIEWLKDVGRIGLTPFDNELIVSYKMVDSHKGSFRIIYSN